MKVMVKDRERQQEQEPPTPDLPRLERWKHCEDFFGVPHLHGFVYNHPKIPDGEYVKTSDIVWFDPMLNLCQTRHTLYCLIGKEEK